MLPGFSSAAAAWRSGEGAGIVATREARTDPRFVVVVLVASPPGGGILAGLRLRADMLLSCASASGFLASARPPLLLSSLARSRRCTFAQAMCFLRSLAVSLISILFLCKEFLRTRCSLSHCLGSM